MGAFRLAISSGILIVLALAGTSVAAQTTYRWVDKASGQTVFSDQPPPPGVKPAQVKAGATPANAPAVPYATRVAAERYPVTLYTMARCLDPCRQARELLNHRGIPFAEKMANTAEEQDELAARLGSEVSIPSLFVGTQSFRGFEATAWNNLLDLAGYPTSAPYGTKPSGIFSP